eukprot:246970-Prymnesium_polylepis.1
MPALSSAHTSNSSSARSGALGTQHDRSASKSVVHARRVIRARRSTFARFWATAFVRASFRRS